MVEIYKWTKTDLAVQRGSDSACIPNDPRNKDWQAFQDWVTAGGIVADADPLPSTAANLGVIHAQSVALSVTSPDPISTLQRAAALVILDQLNLLRQRDVDRTTDIAAATTLADLKTRWALRAALPQINASQIQGAIVAKINAGTAD